MESCYTAIMIIAVVVLSYLIGSIPTSIIIAKKHGIDIRQYGSHNAGGTNVGRVIGKKEGIFTMILDILKCYLPCLIVFLLCSFCPFDFISYPYLTELFVCLCGISVAIGHTFPLFAHFKGGKAVACFAGFVLFIIPLGALIGLSVFFLLFAIFKKVSLSSIIGAPSVLLASLVPMILDFTVLQDKKTFNGGTYFGPNLMIHISYLTFIAIFILVLLIVIRHYTNIKRLAAGVEPETHFKKN
ncbi:MAG: glycerol-3-phosphate 1-O-acyltransferase PlsY [Bacilli bacterium]